MLLLLLFLRTRIDLCCCLSMRLSFLSAFVYVVAFVCVIIYIILFCWLVCLCLCCFSCALARVVLNLLTSMAEPATPKRKRRCNVESVNQRGKSSSLALLC